MSNLDFKSWLVIIGVAVAPFVVIKKVLFAKTDKLFEEVAQKLKLNFRPGFLGPAKAVGNYKGFELIVRSRNRVPGAVFLAGQLTWKKSWIIDRQGLKQVTVRLPQKVKSRVVGDNIVVWKDKLTLVFKPKGMLKAHTSEDIIAGVKKAVLEAKKLA